MINWIPKKKINVDIVEKLTNISLKTNHFTNNGPNVQLLEKIIKDKLQIDDSKAIIAVTNGSVALQSLTTAMNYFENNQIKWATQSFTFPPSAQGITIPINIIII